jgi:endonuclease/exonuclease/phosphatase (EEP) superfamily protein YafD
VDDVAPNTQPLSDQPPRGKPPRTTRRLLLQAVLYGVLILLILISVGIPFFWIYPLELLSNFRVYYLLLANLLAIIFLVRQLNGLGGLGLWLSLGLMAFNSIWIIPWYLPNLAHGLGSRIRVLTFNINVANERWDDIADAVRKNNPDVATIIETSAVAKAELEQRFATLYPYVYRTSGGGIAIFSRFPLLAPQTKTFANGSVLTTTLQVDQTKVELVAVHPIVPIKPGLFKRRNALLAELTPYVKQQTKPLIFLGDFNLTPWSPYYMRLVSQTNLHNTRLGFGIEPSWIEAATHVHHPKWLTALVKIPIDHILVSKDIKVLNCTTQKAANSDHRMLWSDLIIEQPLPLP